MTPDRLLALFPGRTDAYGLLPAGGKYVSKPGRLTATHARAHLRGEVRIGRYVVLPDGKCWWGVVDADTGGVAPVLDLRDVLRKHRLPFAVERSKEKGHHIWMWFAVPVPAWKARGLLRAFVAEAGWPNLEVFPKQDTQDTLDGKRLGNFVNFPLHGESVKQGRTVFVNLDGEQWPPYKDQLAYLESVPKISEADLDRIIAAKGTQEPDARTASASDNGKDASHKGTTTLDLPPCAACAYAEGIVSPGRGNWAHFLARHFRRRGLPEEATVQLLLVWNQKNKPEPLPPGDVRGHVHSAYVKEYTSLGCETLQGAQDHCGDACPVRAKRAEAGQGSAPEPPQGDLSREGDDFRFVWAELGVEIRVTRLRDGGDGPQAELTVSADGRALHWGRAFLASVSAREGIVKKLNAINAKFGWRDILEQVCWRTTEALRTTTPTVQLAPARAPAGRHLVDKLILENEINLIFADGGSGKSLLALALAVAMTTGKALPAGIAPRRTGPVLYLDWESCVEEHQERLDGLLAGLGISGPVPIFYRRMVGAVADEVPALRAEVARLGAVLIVVDSCGPACGTEPEGADAALRAFGAMRHLGQTGLVLSHVSKLHADMKGPLRPFGSVYMMNVPRSVWELRRTTTEEEDTLTVGLYHRKINRGRLLPPFGLTFEFAEAVTRIRAADMGQDASLRERAGLGYSILSVLRAGARTIPELVEELEAVENSVKVTLYRLEKAGKVAQLEKPAPGRAARWGLKA